LARAGTSGSAAVRRPWQLLFPPASVIADASAEPWVNGERIARAGALLGWDGGRPLVTPADDCTIVMPSLRQLRVGVTVMRLARLLDDAPLTG
jgi:hypothetical protein